MRIWWQVYYYDIVKDEAKVFGFSTRGTVIVDHPDYNWRGRVIQFYKPVLKQLPYLQVVKICESV